MDSVILSAIDIEKLWYGDPSLVTATLTGTVLAKLLENESLKEIKNVHQDTWTVEESEAQQDSYRNQLTGGIYRMGRKTPGEVTAKFTIGQYDYALKAEFLGGEVVDNGKGWKRSRDVKDIYKLLIFRTVDKQYGVFPYAAIKANEANTDKAVGIAVTGTANEPKNAAIASEYWFDESALTASAG